MKFSAKNIIIITGILLLITCVFSGCFLYRTETYYATFKGPNGETVSEVPFAVTDKRISEPSVPEVAGYVGKWDYYSIIADNIVIEPIYSPIEYTATFISVTGDELGKRTFTVQDAEIEDAPEAPSFFGVKGNWDYEIVAQDIEVRAVYSSYGATEGLMYNLILDETSNSHYYQVTGYEGSDAVVSVPSIYRNYPVTSIANEAFSGNNTIVKVVLGERVQTIGSDAFKNCKNLLSISLGSGLTSIQSTAFTACYKLYYVYNNSNLTIIAGSTTYGYVAKYARNVINAAKEELINNDGFLFIEDGGYRLVGYIGDATDITLPTSSTYGSYAVESSAFWYNPKLVSIVVPSSVYEIGDSAFAYCENLTSVTISSSTVVAEEAFMGSKNIKNLDIPYSAIGAFVSSSSSIETMVLNGNYNSLSSRSIANYSSLTTLTLSGFNTIGIYAVSNCNKLTSVYILNSTQSKLRTIASGCFTKCSKLTEIYNGTARSIDGNSVSDTFVEYVKNSYRNTSEKETHIVTEGDFVFFDGSKISATSYLIGYLGDATSITLPDNCNGKSYTITERLFEQNRKITDVTIPRDVSVGNYAFALCSALSNVLINGGTNVTIGEGAFKSCSALKNVSIEGAINIICSNAFAFCSLQDIFLPSSVALIEAEAFNYNNNLIICLETEASGSWSDFWNVRTTGWVLTNVKNFVRTYSFESNGGSVVASQTAVFLRETIRPTRSGYVFVGWYVNKELTEPLSLPFYSDVDVTLYAKWRR